MLLPVQEKPPSLCQAKLVKPDFFDLSHPEQQNLVMRIRHQVQLVPDLAEYDVNVP